jgi:hypothetical protein
MSDKVLDAYIKDFQRDHGLGGLPEPGLFGEPRCPALESACSS